MLSSRQRIARMRRVAVRALDAYPLADPELRFIADEENTTFRVDATAPDGRDRFLLRVHRPARHGRNVDSAAAIGSELDWLTALRAGTDLMVPVPFRTIDGKLTTVTTGPEVPEPRVCSVLRWMDGRVHSAAPRPVHLRRLGGVMARLHNHAGQWRIPRGFVRIRWDWETFFGDTMVYGGISAADVWDLLPDDLRRKFAQVASDMRRVMTHMGEDAGNFGLIHADLHLDNALFWRDEVRVIDFDDCGFGYWLYDIAVSLWELRYRDDYQDFRSALIDGYTQHRPLPHGGLAHLDDFIAAREVAFGLWFTGAAQVNPVFRTELDQMQADIGRSLDTLLRN
ncbi:MAG TPA: phosphotransferase [Streptosporangiaceae bacterium]|nr:phosphotransferase [Streptosporangiaceae bacterium]